MIELRDVAFSYGDKQVIGGLTLAIPEGEFLCVVGPNGAGKTTMLRLITGLLVATRGSVTLEGDRVSGMHPRAVALRMAMVPQVEPAILPTTVRAAVLMGRYPHLSGFGFEGEADRLAAGEAMRLCGIEDLASRPVTSLSGGEQHRVLIARALAQQTPVLLLDEPNAHLDLRYQKELFDLLARLNRQERKTVVCVTHDLNLAAAYAKRVAILAGGSIAADGSPREVLTRENIARHFNVDVSVVDLPGTDTPGVFVIPE
jgi:iron complex transport system ATP-binding protein